MGWEEGRGGRRQLIWLEKGGFEAGRRLDKKEFLGGELDILGDMHLAGELGIFGEGGWDGGRGVERE